MKKRLLVVGGAGYIGSHMVKCLVQARHEVVVADNLSTGFRNAVQGAQLVELDIADRARLDALFSSRRFDAVMHFASFIQVGESVVEPGKYYANNVMATLALLQSMVCHSISRFIFSSTASVYGDPEYMPIDERHPKRPASPYGRAKRMVEEILEDFDRAYGLKSVCLRYFNAAGADPEGMLGERHEPETHLIPIVLQAASGRRPSVPVFGLNYDTPDGTCIRDYVHVNDLCEAHALALDYLMDGGESTCLNLGNGAGFSVLEMIEAARRVTARPIRIQEGARRPGDAARLVADSRKARQVLGWHPRYADLEAIITHAWAWERKWPWDTA